MNSDINKNKFTYESIEIKRLGPNKTVRKVSIRNGKGTKSVSKYINGKHVGTIKKYIDDNHIPLIKGGTFISGLFADCGCDKKSNTNKKINKNSKTMKRK